MSISYELSPARQFVMEKLRQHPGSLLLTSRSAEFVWDPKVDNSRLHFAACYTLLAKSVSGPATVIIHSFDIGQPQELWSYIGTPYAGRHQREECYDRLPSRVLHRFPAEGIKVLQVDVPPGERIRLSD